MRTVVMAMLLLACSFARAEDDLDGLIRCINDVRPRGAGTAAATKAAQKLSGADSSALPRILTAMNHATPLSANWLRGAFEAIADRTLQESQTFPTQALIAFFERHQNDPRARRLAFEWIGRVDPDFAGRVIPKSLDDPSSEMRRDAVAVHLQQADALLADGQRDAARDEYLAALSGAGDADQLQKLSAALKDLGHEVNLVQHRGLLVQWDLIGPFDNTDQKGFDVAYPPESKFDRAALYDGKLGKVGWKPYTSKSADGSFDIANLVQPYKGAIMYAAADFESDRDQPVEFRLSTPNAWKLWLNGQLLFAREEYHRGMFFDQYQVRGDLRQGNNSLLLKVCQNEQTEDWAQDWTFQFRACDLTGRALQPSPVKTAQAPSAR